MGRRILFNLGWEFAKTQVGGSVTKWQPVCIPHDWLIYDARNMYEDSEGWYRKTFLYQPCCNLPRTYIRFDGVYMDSSVWVNGRHACDWKYGYSTFEVDITDYLTEGDNEIVVKVVHQSPNSRWYSGAGIYRNVWLISRPKTHIAADGIYVSTVRGEDGWHLLADVEVEEAGYKEDREGITDIEYIINDSYGNQTASYIMSYKPYNTNKQTITADISVGHVSLWSTKAPNLYYLTVNLLAGNDIIDSEHVRFGFRTIEYRPDEGLLLNGEKFVLNGVCMHHDLGCLGAAVNKSAIKRQLEIMKSMGANAIRTAHNMPAPELLDLADEMGMLVNDEAFDMWELSKTTYDYARFFREWHERDVASWVRRDRNHPCVIMWSIGNEIYDTHAGERGQEVTRMLMELVHKHDPRHNAHVTIGSNYMPWENAGKCADIVKLAGYNYAESYYDEHHKDHEDRIIYGSETSSVVQSRRIYHFPADVPILDDDDLQCSSLGNSITSWGAKSIEACIADNRDAGYSAGMFIWSGFDYIGEPTPYHTKNCYFGQTDTAGFPKDSYYVYQAEWTDYRRSPMVHVFPYWDFNPGQIIDVMVCSNAPEVELFCNGQSLGRKNIDHSGGRELIAKWKVPYKSGELKAVAYNEDGVIIAEDYEGSFSDAVRLSLVPDKYKCNADGQDLIFIEISTLDKNGNEVANANNRVNISVEGAGILVGTDNGDSTDYDSYKQSSRRLFGGRLLAVVAPNKAPGQIKVRVSSPGMEEQVIQLEAVQAEVAEGICRMEPCMQCQSSDYNLREIPIRKIELAAPVQSFDAEHTIIEVSTKIWPAGATFSDIEYRLTDDRGVTTGIAKCEVNGDKVILKALADGNFRLRATANNGKSHADIISQLEFSIEGLGAAYHNPYELISGCLYSYSEGDVSGGNERGVATPRDHDSIIVYDNIDFGDWGSDEITIPIFELDSAELRFEIWDGLPYAEGSSKLVDAVYNKQSVWNTYQEETYKLSKRLKGIASVGFVFHRKAHIKGFRFTRQTRAYERLAANNADNIYGDTYTVTEDAVIGIGNNVSLVYDNMDFGDEGLHKVKICGRTPLANNTIHIRFENETESINQIIEFGHSEGYSEREFELENVSGNNKVSFVFLPGSNYDFAWFEFT